MKTNPAVWLLSALIFVPFLWLVASAPGEADTKSVVTSLGALVTGIVMVVLLWRGHRAGRWVANRCETCERPMRRIRPGEIRPPSGAALEISHRWRCIYCGRLV